MACYNAMVPYLCPDLPEKQKQALGYCVKHRFFTRASRSELEIVRAARYHQIVASGSYHSFVALDFPVSIGDYKFPASRMNPPCFSFCARHAARVRRAGINTAQDVTKLQTTPFDKIERSTREQLQRMLGSAGFDAARDIAAINRESLGPRLRLRIRLVLGSRLAAGTAAKYFGARAFGRITIANSDSAARAYTDAAIDEAHRAVSELPK